MRRCLTPGCTWERGHAHTWHVDARGKCFRLEDFDPIERLTDRIAVARGLLRDAFNGCDPNDDRRLHLLDAYHATCKADRTVEQGDGS